MKIEQNDEGQLTLWFADAVGKSSFGTWGIYSDDLVAPELSQDLQKRLDKYLDTGGIGQFYRESLNRRILSDGLEAQPDDGVMVYELPGYGNSIEVAKKLVEDLREIPSRYRLLVRGPAALSAVSKSISVNIKLSDSLSLVSSSLVEDIVFETGIAKLDEWVWRYNEIKVKKLEKSYLYFALMCQDSSRIDIGRSSCKHFCMKFERSMAHA